MSADFKTTPLWQIGRRGEIIIISTLERFRFGFLDIGGSTNEKAPFFHKQEFSFIAPDAMAFRKGTIGAEFKTKGHHFKWDGGAATDSVKIGARVEEGINQANYEAYLKFQQETRLPVVLFFLSLEEAELLCATLDELGEPRYSPNPGYPIVGWDVKSFQRVCRFDQRRLRKLFYRRDGSVIDAPLDVPSPIVRASIADFIRPSQDEFEEILSDLVDRIEASWMRLQR